MSALIRYGWMAGLLVGGWALGWHFASAPDADPGSHRQVEHGEVASTAMSPSRAEPSGHALPEEGLRQGSTVRMRDQVQDTNPIADTLPTGTQRAPSRDGSRESWMQEAEALHRQWAEALRSGDPKVWDAIGNP